MLDGCGRNIRYARISVTDLCNLGCLYCKPRPVPKLRHEDLLSVDEIVALAYDLVSAGFEKIRLTGGEPLVRKGIIPIVKGVSGALKNVGMTTNGTLLAGYAEELKKAGLKGVNVSLDTVDPRVYREVSGGDLNDVLKGISAASEVGMKIKINAVLQRGVNDDPLPLADLAASAGAELRMIELMPFASTLKYVGERSLRAYEWLTALDAEYKGSDGKTDFYSYTIAICCGKNVFLGPGGILSAWSNYQGVNYSPEICIGDNVTIGNGYHISSACRISIGNNVLMGKYITIVDNSHGKTAREVMDISPIKRELLILGEVVIDDNVWIADKVTISKGVKIGRGAIIGANSVVTTDVPPYSVVVGSPAKVIKQY